MPVLPIDATDNGPMILVDLTVREKSTGTLVTFRFSDRRDLTYFDTVPAVPVWRTYSGRVQNPGTLVLDLISAWTQGLAAYGIGALVLVNSDSGLDDFSRLYIFDGGAITYAFGTMDAAGAVTRTVFFTGTMEQPDVGRVVTIPVRTSMYAMDRPVLRKTFLGTGGLEGDATVQGRIKPRAFGVVGNVPLIPVDAANQVYFVSTGFFNPTSSQIDGSFGLGNVYDAGLPYIFDPKPGYNPVVAGSAYYSTYAALLAATVAVGHYAMLLVSTGSATDGTYVRLGGLPAGQMTADGGSFTSALTTQITNLLNEVLFSDPSVDLPGGTSLIDLYYPIPGTYPQTGNVQLSFGRYVDDNTTTYADVFAGIAAACAGWAFRSPVTLLLGPGSYDSSWVFGQFPNDDTIGSVKAVVEENDVLDISRVGNPKTPGEGVPPYQVTYECWRNEVVQQSGLEPTVSVNRRALLSEQYSKRTKTDLTVLTKWPLAQALVVTGRGATNTTMLLADHTQDVADGLFAALSYDPHFYRIKVKLTAALMTPVQVNTSSAWYWMPCVSPAYGAAFLGIKSKRFGFTKLGNGTKFQPLTVSLDLLNKEVTYVGWTTYRAG